MRERYSYQPIDESKVNWDKIEEKFGISKEVLERTGAKDKGWSRDNGLSREGSLLNFGKSGLLDVTMLIYGQKVKAAARLQLTRLEDGTYSVLPHFVRKEQKLENAEYMGYTFTKEDVKALKDFVWVIVGARASEPARGIHGAAVDAVRGLGSPRSYDSPKDPQ